MAWLERENLLLYRETKGKLPRLPFEALRSSILGKDYVLSIIFTTPKKITALNTKHRKKTYTPNVLSFPLNKNQGEIYASLGTIRTDAPKHFFSYQLFLPYLLIHSMLHLKGYVHGSKMEKEEARLMRTFGFVV